jgi:DNA polymerase (family 10)
MAKVETKVTLQEAQDMAADLIGELAPHFSKALVAGSIRRGKGDIGDIDIVLIPKDTLFDQIGNIIEVTSGGKKKIYGTYRGRPINLFLTDTQGWGAQLMTATGPAQYNIRKRFLVKRKGMKLNEYGLFTADTDEYLAGKTEKDIYDYLGWNNKAPAERE